MRYILKFVLIFLATKMVLSKVRIVGVKCYQLDRSFSRIELCDFKADAGKLAGFNFKLKLLQVPVTNCEVGVVGFYLNMKKSPPFMNSTWDACAFMSNRKRFRVLGRLYDNISNSTNLNHTCPYSHDIIVSVFGLNDYNFVLPVPQGNYELKTSFYVNKKHRLSVDISFNVSI